MITSEQEKNFLFDIFGEDPLGNIVNWISENLEPDQVYDEEILIYWAEKKGYKKEE